MIPGALALQDHYGDLTLPVVIMAGEGDKVVFKRRAEQLRAAIKGSVLYVVQGAGHMVHYQATRQVAEAVVELSCRRDASEAAGSEQAGHLGRERRSEASGLSVPAGGSC